MDLLKRHYIGHQLAVLTANQTIGLDGFSNIHLNNSSLFQEQTSFKYISKQNQVVTSVS